MGGLQDEPSPELTDTVPFREAYPGEIGGMDVDVGYGTDGETYFIKDDTAEANAAVGALLAEIDVPAPDMWYDSEEDRVLMEDIGPVYDPLRDQRYQAADPPGSYDTETLEQVLAARTLAGDTDMPHNIGIDPEDRWNMFDFDYAGSTMLTTISSVRRMLDRLEDEDVPAPSFESVEDRIYEQAQDIDIEQLRDTYSTHPAFKSGVTGDYSVDQDHTADTILYNVEHAQDRELGSLKERLGNTLNAVEEWWYAD